jgi:hypothetical protein
MLASRGRTATLATFRGAEQTLPAGDAGRNETMTRSASWKLNADPPASEEKAQRRPEDADNTKDVTDVAESSVGRCLSHVHTGT